MDDHALAHASEDEARPPDYWDLVFGALARRPLARMAAAVLALLYASAIFAPLVANGRPYVLEAVDLGGYRAALTSLSPVIGGSARLVREDEASYRARLAQAGTLERPGVPQSVQAALEQELAACTVRLDLIASYLAPAQRATVAALAAHLSGARAAFEDGERLAAAARLDEAAVLARSARSNLAPFDPAAPEARGVELVAVKSYPLLESLTWLDVAGIVLCVEVLTWPLWNPLVERRRRTRARVRRRTKALVVVLVAVLAAVAWRATIGGGARGIETTSYKAALTSGDLVALRAGERLGPKVQKSSPRWPPIPYGFAETHTETMFRPPTWLAYAAIDEHGRYQSGARAAAAQAARATPVEVRAGERARNDPWRSIAGTDELGRDFLTRILWGGRVSLFVGLFSALVATAIGIAAGALAGYFGGWIDFVVLRVIEVLQSLPAFFLILLAMAFTDPDVVPPMVAIVSVIALIRWTGAARLVRAEFLRLRSQEFVLAARSLGFSPARVILRHILPNALGPVLVFAAFEVAAGILTESALSFLGFGSRPPQASWGSLVAASRDPNHWWIQVFPGALIFFTVTCYNLLGDAARDALDPRLSS